MTRSLRWCVLLAGLSPVLADFQVARAEDPAKLPQPATYVSDFAGVVDDGSKQQVESLCRAVYQQAHATIEIVTVHSLDGDSIEDFTTKLEDKWKVGPKNTDRGVLMVFAINDHKRRIEVGYGLEGILNDAKVGDIGRTMVPDLQAGQYGPAILGGVQQIANVIAADAHVALNAPAPVAQHTYHYERVHHTSNWWGFLVFLFIIFVLLHGGGGRGGGGGWLWFLLGSMMGGGGGRGDGGWGGGGGGFGGGDSGGGDFGGGFGGGSGGGGASGDW